MADKKQFRAIKGTRDILPPDSALWNRVEQTARDVFGTYGFGEIRTPILEETELFARSVGAETDIVQKEMFAFEDGRADLPDPRTRILTPEEVTKLEEATRRQEIPDSVANRTVLPILKKTSEQLQGLRAEHGDGSESRVWKFAEFDKLIKDYVLQAQFVRLGDSVALRPEATASVCRAYIENGMHTWPQPVRLYYVGPMFRRERPQKGRYRQFYQIGAEVLGQSDAPAIDAELIEMLLAFFGRVGLTTTTLNINSIGDKNCRPQYVELLREELRRVKDSLGADSQRRIQTNPLRVLDSKRPEEQAIIEELPRISNHLCEACREHFAQVKSELDLRGIVYKENWRLVRGLDYYTRTTFEITAAGLGSQDAVCGGGRYDGLVELLGGPPTKGIGFAIGTDRVILALSSALESQVFTDEGAASALSLLMQRPDLVVAGNTKETWARAALLAQQLRNRGLFVYLPRPGIKLPKVFEAARKLGIRAAILVGGGDKYVVRVLRPVLLDMPPDLEIPFSDIVRYGKLAKLRQDLERALARLQTGADSPSARGFTLSRVAQRLTAEGILPQQVTHRLEDLMPILNSAIHGRDLAPGSAEWALATGNLLLNELETTTPTKG